MRNQDSRAPMVEECSAECPRAITFTGSDDELANTWTGMVLGESRFLAGRCSV